MKKKICLIFLCLISVLACAFGLAACGETSDSGGTSDYPNSGEHTHVWGTSFIVEGATHYQECSECNERKYGEHIFNLQLGESKYLWRKATCKQKAAYYYSCVCGEHNDEIFEWGGFADHDFRGESPEPDYLKEESTCYQAAVYYYSCIYCGKSGEKDNVLDTFTYGEFADHIFNREEYLFVAESATCVTPEEYYYVCKWCSEHGDETFTSNEGPNPNAHDFSAEFIESKYLKEVATCQNGAEYYYACILCGELDEGNTFYYGEIGEHKFDREEADYCAEEATCTDAAHYYYMCEWCDEHNDDTFEYGEPLGHDWGVWEISTTATVDRNGKKTHSCYREDCLITEEETIPQLIATAGLEFKLSADESYYACTGVSTQCNEVSIIIPSSYRGLPVKTVETAGDVYDPVYGFAYDKGSGFKNTVSVIIPDSVTEIGYNAFKGCTKLESVTFGDNVETIKTDAFNGCSALVEISFGASLKNIMPDVFNGCDKLLEIDNSVFYVNNWVVDCYKSVTSVTLRSDTVGLCQSAFQDCNKLTDVVIVGELKTISATAFYNCSSLTNITIGSNVTEIEGGAFYNCNNISNIYYKGDLTGWINISSLDTLMRYGTESKKLFINGSELKGSLTIPNDTAVIGRYAFYGCRGITSVSIPNGIKEIGDYAFDYCTNITDIKYEGSLKDWLMLDVATNILFDRELYLAGAKVEGDIVIPNGISSIRDFAFYGCSGITSITIPYGVTSIGNGVFQNCNLPTSITIPDSVIIIGNRAFYGCSGITDLTIGSSVREIGGYAFYGCTDLMIINVDDIANWSSIVGIENLTKYGSIYKKLLSSGEEITNLVIPEGVTRISSYAFHGFRRITRAELGSDVAYIGHGAFLGCNLTSVWVKSSGRWKLESDKGAEDRYIYEYEITASNLSSFDEYNYCKSD